MNDHIYIPYISLISGSVLVAMHAYNIHTAVIYVLLLLYLLLYIRYIRRTIETCYFTRKTERREKRFLIFYILSFCCQVTVYILFEYCIEYNIPYMYTSGTAIYTYVVCLYIYSRVSYILGQ